MTDMTSNGMDDEPITTPEPLAPVPLAKPAWAYFLMPTAVIIAAVLISGSVLYGASGSRRAQVGSGEKKTGTISYTVQDIKKWAGTIKGLDKKAFQACLDSGIFADIVEQDRRSGEALGMVGQNAGTPTFFINGIALVGAQPYAIFQQAIDGPVPPETQATTAKTVALTERDHVIGRADAPVTIVEYSDFQCPFCRKFFDDTLPHIRKDYIDTGKAKLIYRHFPLSNLHPMAEKSAEASECTAEQGKFWEFHDALFALQAR